jgi:hypothetical protein
MRRSIPCERRRYDRLARRIPHRARPGWPSDRFESAMMLDMLAVAIANDRSDA